MSRHAVRGRVDKVPVQPLKIQVAVPTRKKQAHRPYRVISIDSIVDKKANLNCVRCLNGNIASKLSIRVTELKSIGAFNCLKIANPNFVNLGVRWGCIHWNNRCEVPLSLPPPPQPVMPRSAATAIRGSILLTDGWPTFNMSSILIIIFVFSSHRAVHQHERICVFVLSLFQHGYRRAIEEESASLNPDFYLN